jgi:integrase
MVQAFLAHGRTRKGRELRPNTIGQYRRNFAAYIQPKLGARVFREITRRDVAQVLTDIARKHTTTARLIRAMLGRLWTYGIEVGEVEYSVVAGTPSYDVPKGRRVLTDDELQKLWQETREPTQYHRIIRLLLLLGCRRGEIGGLRRSELVNSELHIPGTRTKNHADLVLPLPRRALTLIKLAEKQARNDGLLFGRTAERGFTDWEDAKKDLDERLGFKDWDIHDLRRTVETRMAGLRVPKDISNRVLNHAIDPITQAYDHHDYRGEKARALRAWANELKRVTSHRSAEVIDLDLARAA